VLPAALASAAFDVSRSSSLVVPSRGTYPLTELLADEFIEFGSSGRVYSKSDLVVVLHAEKPVAQTASDFNVVSLAPDVALLTYKIRRHTQPPMQSLRSSVWRRVRPLAIGLSPSDDCSHALACRLRPEAVIEQPY